MEIRTLQEKNLFEVSSEENSAKFYTIDLMEKSCTCAHFRYRGVQCKHIRAVEETQSKKHEGLIYTDSPPERLPDENFHYELIY